MKRLNVFCGAAIAAAMLCALPAQAEPSSSSGGAHQHDQGHAASLNAVFQRPDIKPDRFSKHWESDQRSIYAHRAEIVAAMGLKPGQSVADVGAGTGSFLGALAVAVGPRGKVYAIDISAPFIAHIKERAAREALPQVEARLGTDRALPLQRSSIDAAFICDTYHHFEAVDAILGSLHAALKRGGVVLIVDFRREEGVSSTEVLNHVTTTHKDVVAQMERNGFAFEGEFTPAAVTDNYVLKFRKR